LESIKERGHLGDFNVDGNIIFKEVLGRNNILLFFDLIWTA
jgi:hypothetical protein